MKKNLFFLSLFLAVWSLSATVNKSISIADGQKVDDGLSSVNGSIHVGRNCQVAGECETVNGRIDVGANSEVGDLSTVNGRIAVDEKSRVLGEIESVNGGITCRSGVRVSEGISSVNGAIDMDGTLVEGSITVTNGDITLSNKSTLRGQIRVKKNHGFSFFGLFSNHRHLDIRLQNGSVVEGDIYVEDDEDTEVTVYISTDSSIKGKVINAKVVKE